jgi:futalosine hydrolase
MIGGRTLFTGTIGNHPVALLITGPGMVNAAQALTAVLEKQSPLPVLVIQCGCAGAFRQSGLTVGDIAVASQVIDAESGIEAPDNEKKVTDPLPFAVLIRDFVEIKHVYPVDRAFAQSAFSILKHFHTDSAVQVQSGPIISVSTITASDRRAHRLYTQFQACMEAMEGAAAAHVALHYRLPFIEIRAASNHVGPRDRNAWNLTLAFERCAEAVATFIQYVDFDEFSL